MRAKQTELPFEAGIVSDNTDLAAKGKFINGDKVRFRGGRPQTIRGWTAFNASGVASGTARGNHAWTTLDGTRVYAIGTESAVYAWIDGSRITITPLWLDATLNWGFNTTNGTKTVRVSYRPYTAATGTTSAASPHNVLTGMSVTISNATRTVGGLTMNGTWTVTSTGSTWFQFTHTNNASSTVAETDLNDEGAPSNPNVFLLTVGFQTGLATGTGDSAATRTRVYSMDNFGENLVFCGSDGTPIFAWQPETVFSELITNGTFAASTGWALGTGWAISGSLNASAGTASNASQYVSGVLEGGRTYEMVFTVSGATGGTLQPMVDTIGIYSEIMGGASSPNRTYTFRFVCPPNPQDIIFAKDNTFDGSVDNVSVKLYSLAFPIYTAPQQNFSLFVDGNRILNAIGTVEEDGDFGAVTLRWCNQDNYYTWNAGTDSVAGDFPLGKGSYSVGGVVAGSRNLIFTDDTVFSAYFNGAGYSIEPLAQGCGLIGRNAVAVYNGKAFWCSRTGFHMYDGQSVLAIECPVKDRIIGHFSQYQANKTFAWANTEFGEIWWHYAHADDGNEVSRYVSFNMLEKGNPWHVGTLNRTIMVRAGTFDYPIGADTSGNVWYHENGNVFSGTGITLPFIETGYINAKDGDNWIGSKRYFVDVKDQTGAIDWTITFKGMAQGQLNTQTIGPLRVIPNKDKVDFRGRGRQVKLKWESVPSTTYWRMGVVSLEMLFDGERNGSPRGI